MSKIILVILRVGRRETPFERARAGELRLRVANHLGEVFEREIVKVDAVEESDVAFGGKQTSGRRTRSPSGSAAIFPARRGREGGRGAGSSAPGRGLRSGGAPRAGGSGDGDAGESRASTRGGGGFVLGSVVGDDAHEVEQVRHHAVLDVHVQA